MRAIPCRTSTGFLTRLWIVIHSTPRAVRSASIRPAKGKQGIICLCKRKGKGQEEQDGHHNLSKGSNRRTFR